MTMFKTEKTYEDVDEISAYDKIAVVQWLLLIIFEWKNKNLEKISFREWFHKIKSTRYDVS